MDATEPSTRSRETLRGVVRSLVLCAGAWLVGVALSGTVVYSQGAVGQGRGGQGAAQRRSVEGTLEVLYEDGVDSARLRHFLNTGTERIPLRFERNPSRRLIHGSRVRMGGTPQSDGTLMLTDGDVGGITDLGGMTTMSLPGMSLATPNTFGPQSTLVILFTFSDLTTQPFTPATAQSVTFTDANNFDLENSFGQTSLVGTVTNWLSIAMSSTSCSYNTWALLADTAATNAGFNLANYPRRVYAFPHVTGCSWIGLGTVGGGTTSNPSRAWINGSFTAQAGYCKKPSNFCGDG